MFVFRFKSLGLILIQFYLQYPISPSLSKDKALRYSSSVGDITLLDLPFLSFPLPGLALPSLTTSFRRQTFKILLQRRRYTLEGFANLIASKTGHKIGH